jgi:tetratricopeptide (TPR) repeat protein
MPSHIYARVARYDDALKVNRLALDVDEKYIAEQKVEGFYPLMYTTHNVHFIWFAACMEGRYAEAIEAGRRVVARIPPELVSQQPMVEFVPPVPVLTLIRFGHWNEALAEPMPPREWKYSTGAFHYARGVAYAAKGRLDSARTELGQLREVVDSVPADQMVSINYAKPLLRIGLAQLEGEIAARAKKWDAAIASLELAVAAEDSLVYDEPPTWYMPPRQRLGAVLLDAGRAPQAEKVFRADLSRHPENGWSLYGLAQALRAQKRQEEALAVAARFQRAWKRADVRLTAAAY